MNKSKNLALFALFAMLFACGSQDGSPPKLINDGETLLISPFDTLVAKFNSKITNVKEENLSYRNMKLESQTDRELRFVGTENTANSGLEHFKPEFDKKDSIVFVNIKNNDGYELKRAVLYYYTYPIFDTHPGNDNESTPDDIEKHFGKARLREGGVTFAGTIGLNQEKQWADFNDHFTLTLKAFDELTVTLSGMKNVQNVDLEIIIPSNITAVPPLATVADGNKSIKYKFNPQGMPPSDYIENLETNEYKDIPFKIKVSAKVGLELTPYLLTVKID
ncbi:MAG: hypothetical protein LBU89_09520 [Fibromonadaceae bacterium]|jgi:hypothetical protein|nr:hypothetical protein [Fibromonadaceae bacterium]